MIILSLATFVLGKGCMPDPVPTEPFFLIVVDPDRRIFSVEGPITDRAPWNQAADEASRRHQRHIQCGPSGPDREALAADYRQSHGFRGVPPGSIVRLRG